MYWQRVKRTILARFTLFFLRNPYPELALIIRKQLGRLPLMLRKAIISETKAFTMEQVQTKFHTLKKL